MCSLLSWNNDLYSVSRALSQGAKSVKLEGSPGISRLTGENVGCPCPFCGRFEFKASQLFYQEIHDNANTSYC